MYVNFQFPFSGMDRCGVFVCHGSQSHYSSFGRVVICNVNGVMARNIQNKKDA